LREKRMTLALERLGDIRLLCNRDKKGVKWANPNRFLLVIKGGINMRLSLKSLTFACGLLWGGAILFVGLVNLASPTYGMEFLKLMSSVYPGFHNSCTFVDVLVGTGYGLVDGGIAGLLLGWLYNLFAPSAK
jgi:hypothetical protein